MVNMSNRSCESLVKIKIPSKRSSTVKLNGKVFTVQNIIVITSRKCWILEFGMRKLIVIGLSLPRPKKKSPKKAMT